MSLSKFIFKKDKMQNPKISEHRDLLLHSLKKRNLPAIFFALKEKQEIHDIHFIEVASFYNEDKVFGFLALLSMKKFLLKKNREKRKFMPDNLRDKLDNLIFKISGSGTPLQIFGLVWAGANLKIQDEYKNNLLHNCVLNNCNLQTLELLLHFNIPKINKKNAWENTPLHLASAIGDIDKATLLLNYNANLYLQNNSGLTPIEIAIQYKNYTMADFLFMQQDFSCFE